MQRNRISKLVSAAAAIHFAASFLGPGRAAEGRAGRQQTEDELELIALDRRWGEAVVRGDAAALDLLLADDYNLTEPSGEVIGKAEELAQIKATAHLVYTGYRAEDVEVTVSGEGAAVGGQAVLTSLFDGREVSRRYRYERAFAKRGGGWRITSARMISLPEDEN